MIKGILIFGILIWNSGSLRVFDKEIMR
jgi:hypothetical protein